MKKIQGLSVQKRKEELETLRTEKYIAKEIDKHLKKASLEHLKADFIKILIDESENSDNVNVRKTTKKIKTLVSTQ